MGLKDIFQQGMKEFKRRSAVRKEKHNLQQKEKTYAQQLTDLGKKAWDSQIDLTAYANLKEVIDTIHTQQGEVNTQVAGMEKQQQETEDTRKQKNEAYDSQRKQLEEKKKNVESQLDEQKKILKEAQKEVNNARDRQKYLEEEGQQLTSKAADPQTPELEKTEIRKKLAGFAIEKDELNQKVVINENTGSAATAKITPLEAELGKLLDEINAVRSQQKQVIGDLDKTISDLKGKINESNNQLKQLQKEQAGYFEKLGEKLAAGSVADPAIGQELACVRNTEKEMTDINQGMQKLDQEASPESRRAYMTMIGIIAGAIVVLVIIIILLFAIFGKSDKNKLTFDSAAGVVSELQKSLPAQVADAVQKSKQQPGEASSRKKDKAQDTPKTMADAAENLQSATGEIKKQSEQLHGKEIVVSDKASLMTALPDASGWNREEPRYNKGSFGQLETSLLRTTYKGPDAEEIEVSITDTASASVALKTWQMIFQLNLTREDEYGFQKITTANKMPVIIKYDKKSKKSGLVAILKDRYVVELAGKGEDSLDLLKKFISQVDPSQLQ